MVVSNGASLNLQKLNVYVLSVGIFTITFDLRELMTGKLGSEGLLPINFIKYVLPEDFITGLTVSQPELGTLAIRSKVTLF